MSGLPFFLPTSNIASVLCTCISMDYDTVTDEVLDFPLGESRVCFSMMTTRVKLDQSKLLFQPHPR